MCLFRVPWYFNITLQEANLEFNKIKHQQIVKVKLRCRIQLVLKYTCRKDEPGKYMV